MKRNRATGAEARPGLGGEDVQEGFGGGRLPLQRLVQPRQRSSQAGGGGGGRKVVSCKVLMPVLLH